MRYFYSLFLVASLGAQTAMYPGATATDAQLKVAGNLVQNTLKESVIASDNVLVVNSSAGFLPNMLVTIDGEEIAICGVAGNLLTIGVSSCPNVDGRGVDATAAASHALAAPVLANIDAWHHNAMRVELQATQNTLTLVKNQATVVVAKVDAIAQSANIALAALYAVPAGGTGTYRVSCYVIVTQAATTSSTMPACNTYWIDPDTATAIGASFTPLSTGNVIGQTSTNTGAIGTTSGVLTIHTGAGSTISYVTAGYASVGATPMQYAVHIKLEFLGN